MRSSTPLRRSLLFVPAADSRKVDRALGGDADALILDLEDSVAPPLKAEARARVQKLAEERIAASSEIIVRVNALGSPEFEDDIDAIVGSGIKTIMLPKAEAPDTLDYVIRKLEAAESEAGVGEEDRVGVIPLIEGAAGIVHAFALARMSPRVDAICFGHADFALDMGLAHADASAGVVLHARCQVAIAARAAAVTPIDCVFLAVRDEMAFREDAVLGAQLGFEGKLCIHPSQVRVANEVYTPSSEQVEYAKRVAQGWERAQREGHGVFTLDGKMIDAPLVAVQERILARARRAGVFGD